MSFSSLWNQPDLELPEAQPEMCEYYHQYLAWAEPLVKQAVKEGEEEGLHQAVILLVHRYFDWYSYVPKSHRYRVNETGHLCLFHVFKQSYDQLRLALLAINRPRLFLPPAPLPTPLVPQEPTLQIAGIFLGDEQ